jgi:hypothetical protein
LNLDSKEYKNAARIVAEQPKKYLIEVNHVDNPKEMPFL